ncbi:MAG: ATP-grasp domain-containing protein [Candidatus Woesebacteria bacterium]|nr:ATP-grasp domain-containing protein [Candidatus Woesebacteria bacterium]
MKLSSILGLNARTQQFSYRVNTARGKKTADSKLQTATVLKKAGIPSPEIFNKFRKPEDVFKFAWESLPGEFALKPSRGMGGEGIIVVKKKAKESGGRANLHQGALGVGVDIATGITTKAIWHGEQIVYKPGTERKLRGIKVPFWTTCLETAVKSQIISGLGYLGVDIVLHPEKGPMVLELNAQPGLQIQLANMTGLKKRLERVEDLEVRDAEHGVKIAKALFAERFLDRVKAEEGIKTINVWETVRIVNSADEKADILAKIDTGAWRTSIDRQTAIDLGLLGKSNILWEKTVKSSMGKEVRPIIAIRFYLAGRRIKTVASIANREGLKSKLIIGRQDLGGFLVNPIVP